MGSESRRPLSPHLQIYRLPLTAKLSILFRLAGGGIYLGMLLAVAALGAVATGPAAWARWQAALSAPLGQGVLVVVTLLFYFHMANGIRHLVWDTVHGLEKASLRWSNWLVIAAAVAATALTWWLLR